MGDALATVLTKRLGCRLPVIQTAMGWVAKPELVAASSNAGAFGFLACAVMQPAEAREEIARLRDLTPHNFGVNFHSFQPGADQIVQAILANKDRVRAVSFGRGPDAKMIGAFRDAGILCIPTVGAVKHAQKMVQLGCEMVTVQGGEGGGHTGAVPTTVLLPQVLDAVDVPVVAAGGAVLSGVSGDLSGHTFKNGQDAGGRRLGRLPAVAQAVKHHIGCGHHVAQDTLVTGGDTPDDGQAYQRLHCAAQARYKTRQDLADATGDEQGRVLARRHGRAGHAAQGGSLAVDDTVHDGRYAVIDYLGHVVGVDPRQQG